MTVNGLEFRQVVKRYRRQRALDGLDLVVPRGSVTGLVGSNGAGKTTSMAVAAGMVRAQSGRVDILGSGPFDPARHAGRVSLLPQDALLPPVATVRDLLFFYARLQGLSRRESQTQVDDVLGWVHLSDRSTSPIRTLSHGMRRRVTIAQAFLGNPELVLLDEPLSGLDPREVVNIRDMLRGRRGQQTLVVSSHNLHEIERICDRVVFIEAGRMVRQDSMTSVTQSRQSVLYEVEGGPIPLAALQREIPGVDFLTASESQRLVARFPEDLTLADVNRSVLSCLWNAGLHVLEVRRGAGLEQAYLEQTKRSGRPES
jgi:ABC-type multidrug transport system ATPase subunit